MECFDSDSNAAKSTEEGRKGDDILGIAHSSLEGGEGGAGAAFQVGIPLTGLDDGQPRDVVARLLGEQDRKRFSRWAPFSHRWRCVPDPSAKRKDQTEGGELRLSLTFQKLDQ